MKNKTASQRHVDMLSTAFGQDIIRLLDDDLIIEIMLNPDGKLWAESLETGKFFTEITIESERAENIIKLIAAYQHGIANYQFPEIACELPDRGERFQGWLPPVVSQPCFTIRKRARRILTLDHYIEKESLTKAQAELLQQAILNKKNIIIAGGTGSGKTTFANALLNELKTSKDRILVLEDLPELQVATTDVVYLRTSETKIMRDLVKGTLRMRPDRIIIGEVRDGAALELLKAWNTGHPGGISTVHANSAQDVFARLEDLIQEVVAVVPQRLIKSAIDLVIFMQRDKQGKHRVKEIIGN